MLKDSKRTVQVYGRKITLTIQNPVESLTNLPESFQTAITMIVVKVAIQRNKNVEV